MKAVLFKTSEHRQTL